MKFVSLAAAVIVVAGITCAPALARDDRDRGWFDGWHDRRLSPAPAPLLAAGISGFIALGGGVAASGLVRRFCRQK